MKEKFPDMTWECATRIDLVKDEEMLKQMHEAGCTQISLGIESLNNDELIPGTATIFFVNDDGVAITCKHVVNTLIGYDKIQNQKAENITLKNVAINFPNCYEKLNSIQ